MQGTDAENQTVAPRAWARRRIRAWLGRDAGSAAPALLLTGPPGSGKSTFLSDLAREFGDDPDIGLAVAVLRSGRRRDPFQAGRLVRALAGALPPTTDEPEPVAAATSVSYN